MKIFRHFIPLMLLVLVLLVSCDSAPAEEADTQSSAAQGELITFLSESVGGDMVIVYDTNDMQCVNAAGLLKLTIRYQIGLISYKTLPDTMPESAREILIGDTGRQLSTDLIADINKKSEADPDALVWGYAYRDGKLAFAANSEDALDYGLDLFESKFGGEKSVMVPDALWDVTVLSRADYNAELQAKADQLAAEEAAKKLEELNALRDKVKAFDLSKFGTATKDISKLTSVKYSTPTQKLKDEHPRVGLTADMLPAIKAAMENPEYKTAAAKFKTYVETDYNGILPPPSKDFQGRKGLHNCDKQGLAIIEAKALNYLLTGEEIYGWQAISALLNYIDTLDIQYINSDQCRDYGYVMFIAAEVYDWCYPLLTDELKAGLIAGVETRLCAGKVGNPTWTSNNSLLLKMEVGFPPTGQSGVNGHGSEMQILRDYLAFSIAIYDENSSWWNFCAGRLQDDFIPFRLDYYKTGLYPQGSSYVNTRFYSDLYSAWLYMQATGENPYTGIGAIVPSIFSTALPDGVSVYGAGDSALIPKLTSYRNIAILTGAVTGDPLAWSCARAASTDFGTTGTGYTSITASAYLILVSGGTASEKNLWDHLDVIQYNGYHMGQLVSRAQWEDTSAPSTWMKMGVKTTSNHEHGDAGTFQIYYKGMLSNDGGVYSNYGHYQTRYYHQSTVSHNGLLIADPALANPKSSQDGTKWYTGSQVIRQSVTDWLDSTVCDIGVVTGMEYGYKDAAEKQAKYAYLAGDITKSYTSSTVDYVGRRMLTVYTDNPDFPMVLFVYDDITSDLASYKKTFLLQISSKNAPMINGNTVTTVNGEGRLVLTSLTDGVTIEGIGGEGKRQYINGMECISEAGTTDGHWGRIEISHPTDSKDDTFLNVLYVTDAGNKTEAPAIAKITGEGVTGSVFGNVAALFATSRERNTAVLSASVSGSGDITYYVSGLYDGSWMVSVDGKSVGKFTATEEGGMITFTAPAGNVVITPGEDVLPADSSLLRLELNGASAVGTLPEFYSHKTVTALPAASDLSFDGNIFLGWFETPDLSGKPLKEIPAGREGTLTLYAGWKIVFVQEDYSSANVKVVWQEGDAARQTSGDLTYRVNANKNAVVSTKSDASGNAYLSMLPGGGYPDICCQGHALSTVLSDGKITFTLDMAKGAGGAPKSTTFRMRADSGGTSNTLPVFVTRDDSVILGSNGPQVGTLGTDWTTYSFVVDFNTSKMYAYDKDGKLLGEITFTAPAASNLSSAKEWLAGLSSWVFNWSISGDANAMSQEILIDNIRAISGNIFE